MASNRKISIFEKPEHAYHFLVNRWEEMAQDAISTRGRFTVALSGGRTPVSFYNRLDDVSNFDLWLKTHIFLADERFVPLHHARSNYAMIRRNLVPSQTLPEVNFHPIPTDCDNAAISAELYKNILIRFFAMNHVGRPGDLLIPCFDFILLGMGEDGHTASLFPQTQDIDNPQRWTMPISENHLKEERISLTLSVINQARLTAVLITGANKADMVKAIIEDNYDCPAARLHANEGELIFVLDQAAASKLKA